MKIFKTKKVSEAADTLDMLFPPITTMSSCFYFDYLPFEIICLLVTQIVMKDDKQRAKILGIIIP